MARGHGFRRSRILAACSLPGAGPARRKRSQARCGEVGERDPRRTPGRRQPGRDGPRIPPRRSRDRGVVAAAAHASSALSEELSAIDRGLDAGSRFPQRKRLLMKKLLLWLFVGIWPVILLFAIPTIWFKPWSIDHYYMRVFLRFAARHPLMMTQLGLLDGTPFDFYSGKLENL